jgi:hypothetical protein
MEGSIVHFYTEFISPACLRDITPSTNTKVDLENDGDTTLTRARTTARTIICSDALGRQLLLVARIFQV